MRDGDECPECGGPIIDAGGKDVRCESCGLTLDEFEDAGEDW
ncbi:unannotated protein [freshwater metagenome]|uniref:Unannotated protein n=1 Tax=freshwater metagenome TaxID=449393 RepID=A0A6J6LIW4_9ZZZZ